MAGRDCSLSRVCLTPELRRFVIPGGVEGLDATHVMRKSQPRPHRVDNEAGIPAESTRQGREGGQLGRADLNPSCSCSASAVPGKAELHLPGGSSPRPAEPPAPRPPRPAPPRCGTGRYIRAEWPGPRQSAEAARDHGCPAGLLVTATAARSHRSALPAPGRPRPALRAPTPTLPGSRRPANPRSRAALPLALSRVWQTGSGGNPGRRWRCAAEAGEERRARGALGAREAAGCAPRGPRGAWRPAGVARPFPSPGTRPLGAPASQLPAISAGPERRGRGQLFGLGRQAWNGTGGSGPPHVDYLVHISWAQKIHPRIDSVYPTVRSLTGR